MSFWVSRRVKKTRKNHRCEYCGAVIGKGSSCYSEVGTYGGDFNDYRMCERCHEIRPLVNNDEELGDFFDDIVCSGYLKCPSCGSHNLREYEMSKDMISCECECDKCDAKWTADLSADSIRKIFKD